MAASVFVQGSAVLVKDLYCYNVSEELRRFIGITLSRKITELLGEADSKALVSAAEKIFAGTSAREELDVVMTSAEGLDRRLRMILEPTDSGLCGVTVIDIENAISICSPNLEEIDKFRSLAERTQRTFFEYIFATGEIRMFRYHDGKRVPIDDADPLNALMPIIADTLSNNDSNHFDFFKSYDLNGIDHYVRGITIMRNSAAYMMFGTVGARKSETINENDLSSKIDAMTGLYNKPYALNLARKAVESRQYDKVSIIMIDVDDFKQINDNFSHLFGDEVIKRLAVILRDAANGQGFAGRFGGDEFFLCLYNIENEDALRAVLSNITYHYHTSFPNKDFKFTLSLGIAEYPRNSEDFDILLKKADRALYKAKFKGKARYIIYKEEIHGELPDNDDGNAVITAQDAYIRDLQMQFVKKAYPTLIGIAKAGSPDMTRLEELIGRFMELFKIEGISVYSGKDFTCRYRFGHYTDPLDNVSYMADPEVQFCFSPELVFSGQVKNMRHRYIETFQGHIAAHNLEFSLHVVYGSFEDMHGIVTFDREQYLGSTSSFELHQLTVFGRSLAQLLL